MVSQPPSLGLGEEIQFDSLSDEELIRRLDELLIDQTISLKWESVD